MTREQIEQLSTKLAKVKDLTDKRGKLEKALEDGKRESIKIQKKKGGEG